VTSGKRKTKDLIKSEQGKPAQCNRNESTDRSVLDGSAVFKRVRDSPISSRKGAGCRVQGVAEMKVTPTEKLCARLVGVLKDL
jgi:hypothetical protein